MSVAVEHVKMARPRAVVFDWDGTLVDSWRASNEAINATMTAFDLPTWNMAETKRHVRHSMRNSFPKYFGDRWQEAADLFYENYARVHIDYTVGLPGAPGLLDAIRDCLKEKGYVFVGDTREEIYEKMEEDNRDFVPVPKKKSRKRKRNND